MVLRGGFPLVNVAPPYDATWAFVLRDEPDGTTRLLARERYAYKRPWAWLIVEPTEALSFVMSQKMLRGIRDRAEHNAALPLASPTRNGLPTSLREQVTGHAEYARRRPRSLVRLRWSMDAFTVFLVALGTALATGLGALPFVFPSRLDRSWLGIANSLASGFMLGASAGLCYEGARYGLGRTAAGALAGAAFIWVSRALIGGNRELHFGALEGADARRALMIVGIMTLHSFAEGVGVGVAFGVEQTLGVLIGVAIAVHNIPEGLAISLVLVPAWHVAAKRGCMERLLQPAAAAHGGASVPLRRNIRRVPADRSRLCRRRDALARRCGSAAGGTRNDETVGRGIDGHEFGSRDARVSSCSSSEHGFPQNCWRTAMGVPESSSRGSARRDHRALAA